MDKEKLKQRRDELTALVSAFCDSKINDEYKDLCTKLVAKMSRKRNCPFERGNLNIWAAAVVYTIGRTNFLFDKSFEPYIDPKEIHEYFGTKSSTVSAKAKLIREQLKISYYFDPEFSTAHMQGNNPFNHLAMINGVFVDIDSLPEELWQMIADDEENEK